MRSCAVALLDSSLYNWTEHSTTEEKQAGWYYLHCPSDSCRKMRSVTAEDSSKPEVGDFWLQLLIQEDVAGFDVPVNDPSFWFFMEVA